MDNLELHPERLATTDERGRRVYLYVADVKGKFRKWRTKIQAVLILFFLCLPWLKINGHQALLLNVTKREFDIFGLSLRAHNAPLLFFVLAAAGFGLFFVTSIWGRVWCGWACPQTVFIDGIFRRIERFIEGSALERRKLDAAPISVKKIAKRTVKWALYVIASAIITHSFLAYFVGTEDLMVMIRSNPSENWGSFLFILISTGIILFDFAWFREQFCIIACPYGRFQSVLMDQRSTVVAYDTARGEPRRTPQAKALAKIHNSPLGDCVNCYRCVQVCPTGIDIRRGTQLECIACTSCIDACDDVMTKLGKPTGLIRYDSALGLAEKKKKPEDRKPIRKFSARSGIYLAIVVASLIALVFSLARLNPVEIAVLRAKDTPYVVQPAKDASAPDYVMNHFKLELSNQSESLHNLSFEVSPEMKQAGVELITALRPLPMPAGRQTRGDIFVRFPKTILTNGQTKIELKVLDHDTVTGKEIILKKELTLVGPFT